METRGQEGRRKWWVFAPPLDHPLNPFLAILTSFNRNFRSRNDGNVKTMNFLASPTVVTAMSYAGKLSFNPMTDSLVTPSGEPFKFLPPFGKDLPSAGFTPGDMTYYPKPTPEPRPETEIVIRPDSQRLEILQPFESHFGPRNVRGLELPSLKVLMRVRGKCTTDHISAAVRWIRPDAGKCSSVPFLLGKVVEIQRSYHQHL